MVKQDRCLTVMTHIEMLPIRDGFVRFERTVISVDTWCDIVLDPPLGTMLLAVRHESHRQFDAMREEFGDVGLGSKLDACR